MRVFVSAGLISAPGTPCRKFRSFTSIQMVHTHTHLLRTIFAHSDVECILRAKTLQYILQLHLTGMGRWRDPAKYQEAAIAIASAKWKIGSRPFPNEEYIQLSQIVPTCHRLEVLKFEFCLKSRFKTRHAGSWLSRLPLTKIGFDKSAGTSGWSAPISSQLMSSFVGSGLMSGPLPPAKLRSFTSLQMVHTHTPRCRGAF